MRRFLKRVFTKMQHFYRDSDWKNAAILERKTANEIIRISEETLSIKFVGFGAGQEGKIEDKDYRPDRPLDILVKRALDDKHIAIVEVQSNPNYTFKTSGDFPIPAHKVERAKKLVLQCYHVFYLAKNYEEVFWLPYLIIKKYPYRESIGFVHGLPVSRNTCWVPKDLWQEGLESLVQELIKVAKINGS